MKRGGCLIAKFAAAAAMTLSVFFVSSGAQSGASASLSAPTALGKVAPAGTNGQGIRLYDVHENAYYVTVWGQNQNGTWVQWPGCQPSGCMAYMPSRTLTIYNWWWVGTVYISAEGLNFQHLGTWTCYVPRYQVNNDFTQCSFD
jgi:hypothetical protein